MRLQSLAFAGYRSFAARGPSAPDRPLEQIELAPLTILLGKNNSGKSTAARLLHHVLLAIGAEGSDPFPMSDGQHSYGTNFRDVQHGSNFFNPLDIDAALYCADGAQTRLRAQLIQMGELSDDRPPIIQECSVGDQKYVTGEYPLRGLLPDIAEMQPWREGARKLLKASCHLGPVRDTVQSSYSVATAGLPLEFPNITEAIAQILQADVELRNAVGTWMAENLEGWRVDLQQSLSSFSLLARRGAREVNLANSGQGIQQVLPVVALCCWRALERGGNSPYLDVIEQPELHLHDAAHPSLGDLLLASTASGRGSVVVETHSESLVLRIRRRIAEGSCAANKVAIIYAEDIGDGSRLRHIPISQTGEVEWWPEGVFSESFMEVKAIRRAQRAHEAK